MKIKKKTKKTMREFLHMLVDKGVLEGLTFNKYNNDWFDRNNIVNIELLTKTDFPRFEISGGSDMERTVTLIEEVEVDEDTKFDEMIEVREIGLTYTTYDFSINDVKDNNSVEFHALINGKLVKIWDKDGGMMDED